MAATSATHVESRTAGILWMLATMFCFISLDTMMKLALEGYSFIQVTWARFFFAFVFSVLFCVRDLPRIAKTGSVKVQFLRSVLLMVTTALFNLGIMQVPLATGTVIMYLSPILVTVLSVFILHEHVGVRRWLGVFIGFVGAAIVIGPWQFGLESFKPGTLFFVMAALTNACYQVATRWVRSDNPLTSLVFTAAIGAVLASVLVPFHWTSPDLTGWLLMAGSGLAGAVGHLCLVHAYKSAPASIVAPFSYSSIVWAVAFGFLIWGDLPALHEWIGTTCIVFAGLYILMRERLRAQRLEP